MTAADMERERLRQEAARAAASRVEDSIREALDALATAMALRSGLSAGGADVSRIDAAFYQWARHLDRVEGRGV